MAKLYIKVDFDFSATDALDIKGLSYLNSETSEKGLSYLNFETSEKGLKLSETSGGFTCS